ncbi:phage tail terminator-like protein [Phaeospirillum tilakii]|uniref:Phage tail terminator-like protein n=1 Tax=Phaeospirillum tilakii TaxID=741673 RepID=A0ABW5CDQ5_9PROT
MISDAAIRAALEAPLGASFAGLPVSRVGEGADPRGPHIRTYLVRERRVELYRGIRRARGMLGILVHAPVGDGIAAAEAVADRIPRLYRPDDTTDGALPLGARTIVIREVSVMSPYRGVDEATAIERWLIVPVQIDWRLDITAP